MQSCVLGQKDQVWMEEVTWALISCWSGSDPERTWPDRALALLECFLYLYIITSMKYSALQFATLQRDSFQYIKEN